MRDNWFGRTFQNIRMWTQRTYTSLAEQAELLLFAAVNATLLVANAQGPGWVRRSEQLEVMFGMGRDRALPKWFGYVHPATAIPSRNVILCGALALGGAWAITYQLGAELLNFGAFLAFSGVNAACFLQRDFP